MKKQLEPGDSHEQLPDDGIKHLLIEVGMGMEKINGKAWTAHPIHNFAMETESRKGQKQQDWAKNVDGRVVLVELVEPRLTAGSYKNVTKKHNGHHDCGIEKEIEFGLMQRESRTMDAEITCQQIETDEEQRRATSVEPLVVANPTVKEHQSEQGEEEHSLFFRFGILRKSVEQRRKNEQYKVSAHEPISVRQ